MKTKFGRWLQREKMSVDEFSLKTGIRSGTIVRWTYSKRVPQDAILSQIKAVFPDCPLLTVESEGK